MTFELQYQGFDVIVVSPPTIEGKYTLIIGKLITAYPIIKKVRGRRYRILWTRDYGKRFNRLLRGAFRQYLLETTS